MSENVVRRDRVCCAGSVLSCQLLTNFLIITFMNKSNTSLN